MEPQIPACCKASLPPREVPCAVQQQLDLGMLKWALGMLKCALEMLKYASVVKDLVFVWPEVCSSDSLEVSAGWVHPGEVYGYFLALLLTVMAKGVQNASEGIVWLCRCGVQGSEWSLAASRQCFSQCDAHCSETAAVRASGVVLHPCDGPLILPGSSLPASEVTLMSLILRSGHCRAGFP